MRINSRNIPVKFHPDRIWNDGEFFCERSPQQEEKEQDE